MRDKQTTNTKGGGFEPMHIEMRAYRMLVKQAVLGLLTLFTLIFSPLAILADSVFSCHHLNDCLSVMRISPSSLTPKPAEDHEDTLRADTVLTGKRGRTFACQVMLVYFFVTLSFGWCKSCDG